MTTFTKADLIKFLDKFPEDAQIEVLCEDSRGWSTTTGFKTPVICDAGTEWEWVEGIDVLDFRTPSDAGSPHFGKVFIRFGEQ
jgi:hypothetical protein